MERFLVVIVYRNFEILFNILYYIYTLIVCLATFTVVNHCKCDLHLFQTTFIPVNVDLHFFQTTFIPVNVI